MSERNDGHPLELLTAYADDELSIEDRAVVDRHLAECATCRGHLEATRLLASAMAEEAVPEPPDDLVVRIAQRIDDAAVVPFRRSRFRIPATIAATIAAIGLVGVVAWRQGALHQGAPATMPQPQPRRDEPTAPAGDAERLKETKAQEPAPAPADKGFARVPQAGNESSVQGAREREFAKTPAETKQKSSGASAEELRKLGQLGYVGSAPRERDQHVVGGVVGGIPGGVEGGAPAQAERQDAAGKDALAKSKKEYAQQDAAESAIHAMQAPAVPPPPPPVAPAIAVPEAAAQAANALRLAMPASACAERWVDAGVIATWEIVDRERAQSEIAALASKHGGFVQPADPSTPGLLGVVVPAKRFPAFAAEARSRGIAGLAEGAGDASGACVRQRIGLLPAAPR